MIIHGRGFAHHVEGPQFDPQCKQNPFKETRDEGPGPRVFLTWASSQPSVPHTHWAPAALVQHQALGVIITPRMQLHPKGAEKGTLGGTFQATSGSEVCLNVGLKSVCRPGGGGTLGGKGR